jgi:hypothetical protein
VGPAVVAAVAGTAAVLTWRRFRDMPEQAAADRAALAAEGQLVPLPPRHRLTRTFNAVAAAMDLDRDNYALCVADRRFIRDSMNAPLTVTDGLVRRLTPRFMREPAIEPDAEAMRESSMLVPDLRAVTTTRETQRAYSARENDWIHAHELAHAKTGDGFSFSAYGDAFVREARSMAFWGGLIVAGAALPFAPMLAFYAMGAAGTAYLAGLAAEVGTSYASRICEYRADRNATYMIRDADAALGAGLAADEPAWMRYFGFLVATHPVNADREANIRAALREAQAYAPPLP